MCFGGGGGSEPEPQPQPEPKWWLNNPPDLEEPEVQLNEEATDEAKKRRKRTGTQKLQIPLAPQNNNTSGLGIPK